MDRIHSLQSSHPAGDLLSSPSGERKGPVRRVPFGLAPTGTPLFFLKYKLTFIKITELFTRLFFYYLGFFRLFFNLRRLFRYIYPAPPIPIVPKIPAIASTGPLTGSASVGGVVGGTSSPGGICLLPNST